MKLLVIWAVIALTAVHARTTAKQQTITPQITSLTDKDARQKARVHPAFANAGTRAGLELWRIENFEPVAVPQADVGKFYKGDSYVVLKTTADKRNTLSWDIHYWIGSESSQDESGAAAILTVGLDDKFNGKAIQHRETMGHESSQFLNYFTGGAVRYLDGGHQSGFNHVVTNPGAEKRLFQVKGKKNIRVRQVDPLISSMNKGDVFILDINNDIFVYVGEKSKNVERLKAISVANQIRDQDHNGRGRVEIIDQYSSDVDVQKFFTNLGSGSRDLVPKESAGGDDQTFEKNEESSVILSEVSDSTGKLKITPLSAPFRQDQLKPQETYILDTVSGSIYVWVGKQATQAEKAEAMAKAQQYLTAKNYPSWVHVARIPQGTEPAIFKQYFTTWRDVGMSHSRIVRSAGTDNVLQDESTTGYRLFDVTVRSARVIEYKDEIPDFSQKVMRDDKVYLLINNNKNYIFWIGKFAPENYLKTLNHFVTNVAAFDQEHNFTIIKQGFENARFLEAFEKWDPDMWNKLKLEAIDKNEDLRTNFIDVD
ncbi:gelsolin-like [Pararge aegeria]|nr:gelsolin-like [Pararge aegeria]